MFFNKEFDGKSLLPVLETGRVPGDREDFTVSEFFGHHYAYESRMVIFDNFKYHWTNEGGMMDYGWDWWLNGTNPPDWTGWSQVDGGGNHWPEYEFSDYYNEEWERDLAMSTIDEYLHSGYGTTLAIYSGLSGHALTCWGYEYDDKKGYTDIWVTDSDDDVIELVKCSVSWNKGKNWWTLGDAYNGYHIGGVEGLAATPEPVSSILFVIGGASLVFFRYRRRKRICKK